MMAMTKPITLAIFLFVDGHEDNDNYDNDQGHDSYHDHDLHDK